MAVAASVVGDLEGRVGQWPVAADLGSVWRGLLLECKGQPMASDT